MNYFAELKKLYINERKEDTSAFYLEWMKHKYRHSFKVSKTALDIIDEEPSLQSLPQETRDAFVNSAMVHDISRSFEIPADGNTWLDSRFIKFHGLMSAKHVYEENGERDLKVLIPALMHQYPNNNLLKMSDADFESNQFYTSIDDKDAQKFFKKMRKEYANLSEQDKAVIDMGCDFVKDADKITNLLEAEEMLKLSAFVKNKEPRVSPIIEDQLYNAPYVAYANLETYADEACAYMAWPKGLKFASSKKKVVEYNVLKHIRDYTLQEYKKDGFTDAQLSGVARTFDQGIKIVNKELLKDSELTPKRSNPSKLLKRFYDKNR